MLFSNVHPENGQDRVVPIVKRKSKQPWTDEIAICESEFSVQMCEYLGQQPDQYRKEANGYHEYTYRTSDLGKVVYCGTEIFCSDASRATRTESMLWARRTNGEGGSPFMRFNLNDTYAQSLGGRAQVRVVYLDSGNGKWELRYDSTSGAEKSAIIVQKGNTNQWKEVVVDLQDIAFKNRQEGGTDLSLFNMGDDDDTFHLIEVIRTGAAVSPGSDASFDNSIYLPNLQR